MLYSHLKLRHTSCSMVRIQHGLWVTSQSRNANYIDIHRHSQLTNHVTHVFPHSSSLPHYAVTNACCKSSVRLTFGIFHFPLLFVNVCASGTGYLGTSNNKTTLRRNIGNGLPETKNAIRKHSAVETWTMNLAIRTEYIQSCIQFVTFIQSCIQFVTFIQFCIQFVTFIQSCIQFVTFIQSCIQFVTFIQSCIQFVTFILSCIQSVTFIQSCIQFVTFIQSCIQFVTFIQSCIQFVTFIQSCIQFL